MPQLRAFFLGGLHLLCDGQPWPEICSATARSLLAYLLYSRERPQTRDLLAGTFWADMPDTTARRRLSQALWQVRSVRRTPALVVATASTVRCNPELTYWLDVEAFEAHCRAAARGGEEAQARAHHAVELYRGDLLAGHYDDWLVQERERLREMLLATLQLLVVSLEAQSDYAGALVHARRLVGEDPLSESAQTGLMRLCHLLGRPGEALQQYRTYCRVLASELHTEPSAAIAALANQIAASGEPEPSLHIPAVPAPRPLAVSGQTGRHQLVGRRKERGLLAHFLELAKAGSGGLILIAGPAGIGKSRLVEEAALDAQCRGMRVLWGHCCELSAPPPYQPILELLQAAPPKAIPEAWRRELARVLPELGTPPPQLDPEHGRGRLLTALTRSLLSLGETAPHLLILEDLHWMDAPSLDILRLLLPRLPTSRLLVVCTVRLEDLPPRGLARRAFLALEATGLPRRMDLEALTGEETRALIEQVLAGELADPALVQRLYAETEGNPFFVTETLRGLADQDILFREHDGRWNVRAADAQAELPVPARVANTIGQRLSRLPARERELLGLASIIGASIEFEIWLQASGERTSRLLTAGEELVRRGFLTTVQDGRGYCFAHDKIRRVTYSALSPVRRRLLHQAVGKAIAGSHPERVEELARHFRLSQDWAKAIRHGLQAGERAQSLYAHAAALEHYRLVEGCLDQPTLEWPHEQVARLRAQIAERRGQALTIVGDYEAAERWFDQALRLYSELGERDRQAGSLNQLSFLSFLRKDYSQAAAWAERSLAVLPEAPRDASLLAAGLTHLGLAAWAQGRPEQALPRLEQARALLEAPGGTPYYLARCLNSLGLVHMDLGELERAEELYSRSLELRQGIGDRRGVAWCRHNLARVALMRGRWARARELIEAAQAAFAEIGDPDGLAGCERTLASVDEAARSDPRKRRVLLPRADAPSGRPLRHDELVEITWTLHAHDDQALPGKAARRRQRLQRLLGEAAAQGAHPTVVALAAALEVDPRTVKRDLAALRAVGHPAATRGRRRPSG